MVEQPGKPYNKNLIFNLRPQYMKYYNLPDKVKIKLLTYSIFLASIIFFWNIQIEVIVEGVPFYFFLFFVITIVLSFSYNELLKIFLFYFLEIIYLFVQKLQGVTFFKIKKTFLGLIIFPYLLFIVYKSLKIIIQNKLAKYYFFKFLRIFILLQLIVQVIQLILGKLGIYYSGYTYILGLQRVSGLFSEPSHLAISIMPFFYLYLHHYHFAKKYLGKYTILILIFIAILAPCATLLFLLVFMFLLKLNKIKLKNIIIIFLVVAITTLLIIKVSFIKERLIGVILGLKYYDEVKNVSALAFIKGLQMAYYGITHYIFGVGFLNLFFLNQFAPISHMNSFLYFLNAEDGSSFAFKLIGELGWLGLFLIIYSFMYFFKIFKSHKEKDIILSFFLFGLICNYLRGSTYFDGYPIIGLAVLIYGIENLLQKLMKKTS